MESNSLLKFAKLNISPLEKSSSKIDQSERTDQNLPEDSSPSINLKAKLNISVANYQKVRSELLNQIEN